MTASTQVWLWQPLIKAITDTGLSHIRFVICGREPPDIDRWTKQLVTTTELQPLGERDVVEYLGRRGIPEEERTTVARTLHRIRKGNPYDIALDVDILLEPVR